MAEISQDIEKTLDALANMLRHMKKTGRSVDLSPEMLQKLEKAGTGPFLMDDSRSAPEEKKPVQKTEPAVIKVPDPVPTLGLDEEKTPEIKGLDDIQDWIGDCRRCRLHEKRTKIVFGVGNPEADLMFIGEGPGRDEDIQGEPFVGRAGQLLTKMIESGMGVSRKDVYIANIVKCRPPNNRDPHPDESAMCKRFLMEQIKVIKPKVICALGRIASHNLLEVKTPISKMRGNWYEYMGVKVMPTFHPAALLRNPNQKRPAWEDLKMIMAELEWELPAGKAT